MIFFPLTFFNTFPGNFEEPFSPLGIKYAIAKEETTNFFKGSIDLSQKKLYRMFF